MIICLDAGLPLTQHDRHELSECAAYYGWNVECVEDMGLDDTLQSYAYLWAEGRSETLTIEKRRDGWHGYANVDGEDIQVQGKSVGAMFCTVFFRTAA